ncbi:putative integral membrane protein [Cardiosporidium cionae]|uniref:Integral membrane protein n=1 Tax=Cardiosporidium cionae TaxID=476202 RepID=A0ABQ7J6X2_9APIC|nr:putative integral membrane protein [Cardiosporidium cionae]|eukprot:KAF8819445.1 putative integral membrane protein [Cardiosporidium cionae]
MVVFETVVSKWDAILIITVALSLGIFIEFLSWITVYRHEEFRKLHAEICKLYRKREQEQDFMKKDNSKKGKIAAANVEKEFQRKNKNVSSYRMKANILTAAICMILMPILYQLFDGVPVAQLPFQPIWPFAMMTHAGLPGDDMMECSATFLCMTTLLLTRQNIQKYLGFSPPGGMQSPFGTSGSGSSSFSSS